MKNDIADALLLIACIAAGVVIGGDILLHIASIR